MAAPASAARQRWLRELLAYAVLGESLTGVQLVGGALIVASVVLLSLQAPRAPAVQKTDAEKPELESVERGRSSVG